MLSHTGKLAGCTLFITGASRGIGKAIALKAAKDGANIVIAAKTAQPHPKLPGTIYTAGKEIEDAGGKALPCVVDVRDENEVKKAIENAVNAFGGIDIVVNNASAISLTNTQDTPMKKYDLMNQINSRGTYMVSKHCIPHLLKSKHPHILNISPPLNMNPFWFRGHVAYTMAKYGMSMCVLGMAGELKEHGIACNALWPQTAIYTAAMEMLAGGSDAAASRCRKPEIMADAAYAILSRDPKAYTGNFVIDENILKEEGITNFDSYACVPGSSPMVDFFIEGSEKFFEGKTPPTTSSKSETASSGSAPVAQVFNQIQSLMSTDLVEKTKAIYSFEVTGDDLSYWFINLKEGGGSCGSSGPSPSKADVTLKMTEENFLKMFKGEIQPTAAFMSGKLKIKGDMGKAMKLDKLMGQLKAKL